MSELFDYSIDGWITQTPYLMELYRAGYSVGIVGDEYLLVRVPHQDSGSVKPETIAKFKTKEELANMVRLLIDSGS